MEAPRRSPLFSAVVLAGVSLTAGPLGCGGDTETINADDAGATGDTKGEASAVDSATSDGGVDTAVKNDTAVTTDAGDACPPDSEIPTPPCSFIK